MAGTPILDRAVRSFARSGAGAAAPHADPRADQIAAGQLFDPREIGARPRWQTEAIVRSLCYNAFVGNKTALCRVLGRFQMFVDTTDVGLGTHLLTHGGWEMWHTEALVELLKPGMTAVDVGANVGYFTLLMAELVGPEGRVHAIEPNAGIAALLRRSIDVNGFGARTTVHELALGDATEQVALVVPAHEPKNAYVVPAVGRRSETRVASQRFDAMPELLTADLIKIDVEGSEERVWQGMRGLLGSGRPLTIILEVKLERYADAPGFVDELDRHGFSLSVIDPADGIVPIDRAGLLARRHDEDQLVVLRR